jgi:dissimilatory sulfite reductase (desulfoviridin) alpha/beta subunit
VEEEAARCGDRVVTLEHVKTCRQRFLKKMEDEVKGFQVETCFGPTGCPNRAVKAKNPATEIEHMLEGKDIRSFLKNIVKGPLKIHHEFRVSVSDCPNACSRPQIVDIGLTGASKPFVTREPCTHCNACVEECRESAVTVNDEGPVIDFQRCLLCGSCIRACPSGTLSEGESGYRILVGGKLGRHPRLARDLGVILPVESVPAVIGHIADYFKAHCKSGERLGEIIERENACDELAAYAHSQT